MTSRWRGNAAIRLPLTLFALIVILAAILHYKIMLFSAWIQATVAIVGPLAVLGGGFWYWRRRRRRKNNKRAPSV